MPRFLNPVASFTALFCLLGTVFPATMAQQSIGSRQPDISDWRLFHRKNDEYWARRVTATSGWDPVNHSKLGLSASDVRKIRLLSGIADDEPSDPIVSLDGWRMQEDQYLLVTAKSGGCLKVAVYGQGFRHFKELWSSDALANGGNICQLPGCPEPQVSVDKEHRIDISTYFRSTPESPVCDQFSSTTFKPRGSTFELQDQHAAKSKCWIGYGAGLDAALWQAAGPGETIAIVQVLPSLSPDRYALALQRRASGARVLRMEWDQSGSPCLPPLADASASDCFSRMASVQVQAKPLNVQPNIAEDLATALDGIDLRTDRCTRNAEGECVMFTDGREFHVEVRGQAPVDVFDLHGVKGYMSENPQLSEWIYKLLNETKQVKETAAR
jgi:hypothetical protein